MMRICKFARGILQTCLRGLHRAAAAPAARFSAAAQTPAAHAAAPGRCTCTDGELMASSGLCSSSLSESNETETVWPCTRCLAAWLLVTAAASCNQMRNPERQCLAYHLTDPARAFILTVMRLCGGPSSRQMHCQFLSPVACILQCQGCGAKSPLQNVLHAWTWHDAHAHGRHQATGGA